jgi:hypothetical protein
MAENTYRLYYNHGCVVVFSETAWAYQACHLLSDHEWFIAMTLGTSVLDAIQQQ